MAYFDLGAYKRKITTPTQSAQKWFNRGLIWIYAYNHEEAIECLKKSLEVDKGCPMAHWGIAYAIGPNYNKPWEAFEEEEKPECIKVAGDAINAANGLKSSISEVESALIEAIEHRYPEDPTIKDFSNYNDAYANAMRKVYEAHGDDLDVCALFAEALMNRTPWQLWDLTTGRPVEGADTLEAVKVLEGAFDRFPGAWEHPGLLHMYIHLMEMSPHPERALRHGDALSTLVPDAGHLVHMSTHIDVLCGNYHDVVSRNHIAIVADRKFVELGGLGADNFYTVYRCHNYHFKIYGAMFLGQPTVALETANELMAALPEEFLRKMADWFEGFVPMK